MVGYRKMPDILTTPRRDAIGFAATLAIPSPSHSANYTYSKKSAVRTAAGMTVGNTNHDTTSCYPARKL